MAKNVYASVKAYGKRGKLLSASDLRTLAESRDLDELVTRIKNTTYEEAVSELKAPFTARAIESALRGHLAGIHYSIAKTVGASDVLDAYYTRFIVTNLKMVLKGKALGKPQEEIEPQVNLRAEELVRMRDVVVKAMVARDMEEAVATLSQSSMGEEAAKAAALYSEKGHLQAFDAFFDRITYSHLGRARKRAADSEAERLVGLDIDFYNIMSALRAKFWGLDEAQAEELAVSYTPSAPRELVSRIRAAATLRDAFGELNSTRYKALVPSSEKELDALAEFERSFESEMYRAANRAFTKMFSLGTVVAITKLTAFEVRNMAAIAFAVEQGIPAETVMPKLIAA